jgi:hypothetical protein
VRPLLTVLQEQTYPPSFLYVKLNLSATSPLVLILIHNLNPFSVVLFLPESARVAKSCMDAWTRQRKSG